MNNKGKKFLFYRAYIIYFSFVLIMGLVIYMTLSIQLSNEVSLFDGFDSRIPKRIVVEKAQYGDILDKDMNPIVTTVSYFDVYMDPTVVEKNYFEAEVSNLSKALSLMFKDRSAKEYENRIRSHRDRGKKFLLIQKSVTHDQRERLRELPIFDRGQMKGGLIDHIETTIRKKPKGKLADRTLGYYKDDGNKVYAVGIEGAFHNQLSGTPGKVYEQKLATGWKKTGQYATQSVSGADVVTTIDYDIQEVVHSELEKQLIDMDASHGCVVVMEVKTGYVRAISNLKRNNDNTFSEPYNYAIGHLSTPGSTFKLASLMAALEDKKLKLTDIVNASGIYRFKGSEKPLYDSNTGVGYGEITIQKAFEKSSNVLAPTINDVYKGEPHKFIKRLEEFGLTESLGIKLEGEPQPKISRPGTDRWSGISIPYMAIGYEFEQTPLQTLNLYNTVANNGKMMRPLFVQEIRHSGKTIERFEPVVLDHKICSQSTIDDVKKCLVGVMEKGTGSNLKSVMFNIAGKTGTAKLMDISGEFLSRKDSDYQASFCGYFPAEDPLYSCIVVIYKPKTQIYGAKVSGTVFAAVANKVFASNLKYHDAVNETAEKSTSLPPIKAGAKSDISQSLKEIGYSYDVVDGGEWAGESRSVKKIKLKDRFIRKSVMPNVMGMTAKDAVYLLESMGYVVEISGYGKVVFQSVEEGGVIEKGKLIQVVLK